MEELVGCVDVVRPRRSLEDWQLHKQQVGGRERKCAPPQCVGQLSLVFLDVGVKECLLCAAFLDFFNKTRTLKMQIKGPPSGLPLTLGYCFAQSFTFVLGLNDFFFLTKETTYYTLINNFNI